MLKHAVGMLGMTNFERKKNNGISIVSEVFILQYWPVYLQITLPGGPDVFALGCAIPRFAEVTPIWQP